MPSNACLRIGPDSLAGRGPIYQRLAAQIRGLIVEEILPPGARLPAAEHLAAQLNISRLTVLRAYGVLQRIGLVEGTAGRGTFVSGYLDRTRAQGFLSTLPDRGLISQFESVSRFAGIRSLATALPDPDLFSREKWAAASRKILELDSWDLHLPPAAGDGVFLQEMRRRMAPVMTGVAEHHLLATGGAGDGLSLVIGELAAERGMLVQVPQLAMVQAAAQALRVPMLVAGPGTDEVLDAIRREKPSVVLISSRIHPISGENLADDDVLAFCSACDSVGACLVDLAPYVFLSLRRSPVPFALSPVDAPNYVWVTGLETQVVPGLGLGVIACSALLRAKLERRSFALRMGVSRILQRTIVEMIRLQRNKVVGSNALHQYAQRHHAMSEALEPFSSIFAASNPQGGFNFLVRLPSGVLARDVFLRALQLGVATLPSDQFLAPESGEFLRLSYSTASPHEVETSIQTLARALIEVVKKP